LKNRKKVVVLIVIDMNKTMLLLEKNVLLLCVSTPTLEKKYKNPSLPSPPPSFRKMPPTESLQKVCLLLGFEGFYIQNQYYCRELGWSAVKEGTCGNIKYRMPMSLKQIKGRDRWNVAYVTGRVHGLAFDDDPAEEAKPYGCLNKMSESCTTNTKQTIDPWSLTKGDKPSRTR